MDDRYRDRVVAQLWGAEWTLGAWLRVELAAIEGQMRTGQVPRMDVGPLAYLTTAPHRSAWVREIAERERQTNHDVMAFLVWLRGVLPTPLRNWVHFGLTSSDLVDTAQGLRFAQMKPVLETALERLVGATEHWASDETQVLGYTHGQPAELMLLGHRGHHWHELIQRAIRHLSQATHWMCQAKLSGPVGDAKHWRTAADLYLTAMTLDLTHCAGETQVIPRDYLARWASAAAQLVRVCGKIAVDMRLMNILGEAQDTVQVSSSAMPHKRNMTRAERVGGMVRLAAGYEQMLQPLDLWLERDISNSSVERVAVPDLWHVLMFTIGQTTSLLMDVRPNRRRISRNIERAGHWPHTSTRVGKLLWSGLSIERAREVAAVGDPEITEDVDSDEGSNDTTDGPQGQEREE